MEAGRDGNAVKVNGQTNLPDGALINITASRVARHEPEDEQRTAHAGDATATVEDGAFSTTVDDIDESDLLIGVGTGPAAFGPLAEVDSSLTICVEFRTGKGNRQQDADVAAEVGDNGEQLKGSPDAEEFGSLTNTPSWWLEEQTAVEYPIDTTKIVAKQGTEPEVHPLDDRFCA